MESITDIFADKIKEGIPQFQWLRSLFGEKFNVFKSTDFNGKAIEVSFDPESRTDRFQAAYDLMTLKLASATEDTKLSTCLAIALDRQRLAQTGYIVGLAGTAEGGSALLTRTPDVSSTPCLVA